MGHISPIRGMGHVEPCGSHNGGDSTPTPQTKSKFFDLGCLQRGEREREERERENVAKKEEKEEEINR